MRRGKPAGPGLADLPFAVFGQEVIDAADLVVKCTRLVLRLEHTEHAVWRLLRFVGLHDFGLPILLNLTSVTKAGGDNTPERARRRAELDQDQEMARFHASIKR